MEMNSFLVGFQSVLWLVLEVFWWSLLGFSAVCGCFLGGSSWLFRGFGCFGCFGWVLVGV